MARYSHATLGKTLYHLTEGASKKELPELLESFVVFLAKSKRMKNIGPILAAYSEYADAQAGVREVVVTTRYALSEKVLTHIAEIASKRFHVKNVRMVSRIDSKVIGGINVSDGNTVIENTIASRLEQLRNKLIMNV